MRARGLSIHSVVRTFERNNKRQAARTFASMNELTTGSPKAPRLPI
jgi:hypothetical protein